MQRFLETVALIILLVNRTTSGNFAPDHDKQSMQDLVDNVNLVTDIHRQFKATSVFMIYNNAESLRMMNLMSKLMREFSSSFVPALTMNFTDLKHHRTLYRSRIVRPLFVAFLSTKREVQAFARMSREYEMSYALWLVIFTRPLEELCAGCVHLTSCSDPKGNYFNVAFDTEMLVKCYRDPVIREWYALHPNNMKIKKFATWDPVKRLKLLVRDGLYERRNNLEGVTLRVATIKDAPSKFFKMIMEELSKALNFRMKITHQDDFYGIYNVTSNKWSGIIGRLAAGEIDLGVGEFTMTKQRLDAIDFTQPILQSRNYLYVKEPDGSVLQWSAYFRVFNADVWIAIQVMYVLSGLIITFMRVTIKEKPVPPDHMSENYLCVWGIYCQQGLPDFPKASPMRIAYFSVLAKAVVLLATYSACLISYLTVTNPSLPFSSIEEFAHESSYKLIVLQESSDFNIYYNSSDHVLNKMWKKMPDSKVLPMTIASGFTQVCQKKVAFHYTGRIKDRSSAGITCNLAKLDSGRIDSLALALAKKSQYMGILNYHLQKFKAVGIMSRLISQYYSSVQLVNQENSFSPVKFWGIVMVLSILGGGIVLSLIILAVEIIMHHANVNRRQWGIVSDRTDEIVGTKDLVLPICDKSKINGEFFNS